MLKGMSEMEQESEFIDRMVKAFDYFDVIKKVVECDDIIILKGLKKILDKKVFEMEVNKKEE